MANGMPRTGIFATTSESLRNYAIREVALLDSRCLAPLGSTCMAIQPTRLMVHRYHRVVVRCSRP